MILCYSLSRSNSLCGRLAFWHKWLIRHFLQRGSLLRRYLVHPPLADFAEIRTISIKAKFVDRRRTSCRSLCNGRIQICLRSYGAPFGSNIWFGFLGSSNLQIRCLPYSIALSHSYGSVSVSCGAISKCASVEEHLLSKLWRPRKTRRRI